MAPIRISFRHGTRRRRDYNLAVQYFQVPGWHSSLRILPTQSRFDDGFLTVLLKQVSGYFQGFDRIEVNGEEVLRLNEPPHARRIRAYPGQILQVLYPPNNSISSSDQALHLMQGLALSDDGNDGGDNDDNDDNDGYETDGDDMAGNQTDALVDFLDSMSDM